MRAFPAFQASAPHLASATTACLAVFFFTRTHARDRLSVMAPDASSPTQVTDEIIERCLNGDQAAWESIVRMYRRKVFNVAYKFVAKHDEAEDLTQEIFLKIFKSLGTFDRRANFQTWLISVSRNLCIDHYRSVRKERETIDPGVDPNELAPAADDPAAITALEQRDRVKLLRDALAKLPDALRTAVLLRDIQELSYQEIAQRLGLNTRTIKHYLTGVFRKMRVRNRVEAVVRAKALGVTN